MNYHPLFFYSSWTDEDNSLFSLFRKEWTALTFKEGMASYHTATAPSIICFQQTDDDIAEIEDGCQAGVERWERVGENPSPR
jgi:hypothetical protein